MKRLITLAMVIGILLTSTIVVSAGYPDPGVGKTNIFMQNLGQSPATVSLVFTTGDTGGTAGTYNVTEPIQPRSSKRLLYTEFPSTIPSNWAGAVEVSATEPLAAIVNVLWDNGNIKAAGTYKGVDAPDTKAYVPLLAVRPDIQTSRITVQNTEDAVANITIQFYNRDGALAPQTVNDTIPAKSEKTYNLDQIQPNFGATSGLGSAYITSNKKIAVVGTLHWGASGANASDAYSGFATGDTTLWVPGVFRRYNASCGNPASTTCYTNFSVVTVQNLGDQDAAVQVEFWKDDGTKTVTLSDTIPPKASKPYNTAVKGTMSQANYDTMVQALGSNWRGTIKVISTNAQPLAGLCTYYAPSTGVGDCVIYSAVRDNEATTNPLSFPATYRKRTGGADAQWSTTLIQNLSNTAGQLDIRFFRSTDGSEVTAAHAVIDIPANGSKGLNLKQQVDLPQAALDALGTNFSGAMYVTPVGGNIRIVGETNILWDGAGRGAAYTGFPVP